MKKSHKHTERTKRILSRKNKGKHFSPATEFKRGQIPWNKGLKGLRLSRATEFKRGQRPKNWRPVGTVVLRIEGSRNPNRRRREIRWIKVAEPNVWVPLARYIVMEKRQRKIPKGMIVYHQDNDPLNDDPQNLLLITRSLHIKFLRDSNIIDEKERRRKTSMRLIEYWEEKRGHVTSLGGE